MKEFCQGDSHLLRDLHKQETFTLVQHIGLTSQITVAFYISVRSNMAALVFINLQMFTVSLSSRDAAGQASSLDLA